MEIVLVVAVADNGVIGAEGAIPWRHSNSMVGVAKRPTLPAVNRLSRVRLPSLTPGRHSTIDSAAAL